MQMASAPPIPHAAQHQLVSRPVVGTTQLAVATLAAMRGRRAMWVVITESMMMRMDALMMSKESGRKAGVMVCVVTGSQAWERCSFSGGCCSESASTAVITVISTGYMYNNRVT
jgi:TPP-dependent indolepyruvate ferredoxin oxidoreductase alpha subunit